MNRIVKQSHRLLAGFLLLSGCLNHLEGQGTRQTSRPLTIIAIGDTGENTKDLRSNASYISDMYTGAHGGGAFDALVFLGDNFYPTGLNVPADEVDGKMNSVLGKFKVPFTGLGRSNVHAIAGNHDYYARLGLQKSLLFGLINIEEGPVGFSDKGNKRAAANLSWTYHHGMPGNAFYPLKPNATDSVQLIFFDSAVLLRTDTLSWRPALDSLQTLLGLTKNRPGISWRILCAHHPFYSVGEHGGYSEWNDENHVVEYLTSCDKDSNAIGWLTNLFDPEDLCATKYRQYIDSVNAVIGRSEVKVQLMLSGHEHSLQLLYYPDRERSCDECPKVQIISGAGAKPERVRASSPSYEFTSAQASPRMKGASVPGFVQLQFDREKLRAIFFNGDEKERVDMGNGRTEFWIDRNGALVKE